MKMEQSTGNLSDGAFSKVFGECETLEKHPQVEVAQLESLVG